MSALPRKPWPFRLSRRPRTGLCQALPLLLLLTACPRRFDPRAEEIHGSTPLAESDFRSAEKLLDQGQLAEAEKALGQFRSKYGPAEPLYPLATVHQARALRQLTQPVQAKSLLEPLLPSQPAEGWLGSEARRELGLTEYALGNWDAARRLLAPLSPQIVDGEEGAELHATLGDLFRRFDQVESALREYERWAQSKAVRPGELAYVKRQAALLCERLPAAQQESWRKRLGLLPSEGTKAEHPQSLSIGLLVPMQGRDRALGDRVLRGALWAADLLGGGKQPGVPVDLRLRDSSSGSMATLVAELAQEGAQVILTPPTKAEATQASAEAEKLGLLALSLGPRESMTSGTLQLLRTNRSRAQALGQHLVRSGLSTVAVLAPSTNYGQAMTRAFVEGLQGSAVKVVAELPFAENATTFLPEIQKLAKAQPEALFLPVSSSQLELISSQLAAASLVGTYRVSRGPDGEPQQAGTRIKLLLSPAEGMGERLIRSAGRYLQGAVLAPLSVGSLPVGGGAVARLDYGNGEEPTSLDALGFDAVRLARTACQRLGTADHCTAPALSKALRDGTLEGATGPLGFDGTGQRSGAAMLVRVEGQGLELVSP